MTLKVLIVDDEALARSRLRTLLGDCATPGVRGGGRGGQRRRRRWSGCAANVSMWCCSTSICPVPTV